MPTSAYVLSIAVAVLGGGIAVVLQRRWPHRLLAAHWACCSLGAVSLIAFGSATGHAPPVPRSLRALEAEPWESVILPFLLLCIVWPVLRELVERHAALQHWLALCLASIPLLSALTLAERYSDLVAGNTTWSVAVLLSISINWLAGERMDATGASRWSIWVFVAQLLTVSALYMTCYGTVGEWCMIIGLALSVLAAARMLLSQGVWSSALSLPTTTLSCVLLMHIRDYSALALPYWLAPLPLLLPLLVSAIDQLFGKRQGPKVRIASAAITSAVIAAVVIMTTLSLSGPSENW